jgi:3-phenylpropionate/trans-cinnamate dioxygenase ferredoxin subunit
MNPLFCFLYWNMNCQVVHHMFPIVPYYQLPTLHEVDADGHTYSVYRPEDQVYATDGLLTEQAIECPKNNGRFDICDGRALGAPLCINLKTYPARVEGGNVLIQLVLCDRARARPGPFNGTGQ